MTAIPACASDLTVIAGWERDWHRPDLGVTIPARETWRFRRVGADWVRVLPQHAVSSPLEGSPAGFEGADEPVTETGAKTAVGALKS